jgi:hypothetical protein
MQRVYLNIGSCGEQCWANNFADYRQLDPKGRNFAQRPVSIGQCRRDCPHFRAIEDRLPNVLDYLLSKEGDANDLREAKERALKRKNRDAAYTQADLVAELEREFGSGAVARGSAIFARRCAGCHSSVHANRRTPGYVSGDLSEPDFGAVSPAHPRGLRHDFMGSDEAKPASVIGTYRCRALHSNHMKGHLYEEYGSSWVREKRPVVAEIREPTSGGRGYFRAPSLLNVWATAPYMHNNAIGPEVCGKPANTANDFHRGRYADPLGNQLPPDQQPACVPYDPSVEGRYSLFKKSIYELLHPEKRGSKSTFTTAPVFLDLGIRSWDGSAEKTVLGAQLQIPKGVHAGFLAGFRHKLFALDFEESLAIPASKASSEGRHYLVDIKEVFIDVTHGRKTFVEAMMDRKQLLRERYWSCMEDFENKGHTFGADLPEADKGALTAFLATL